MDPIYAAVLRWVFLCFFAVIGVFSLGVAIGFFPKADPAFKKWAVGTFIVTLAGAVFTVFSAMMRPSADRPVDLFVRLVPPEGRQLPADLNLYKATYAYDEPDGQGGVRTSEGAPELTYDNARWQVKLPSKVLDKAVSLTFEHDGRARWEVRPFYPNSIGRTLEALADDDRPSPASTRSAWPTILPVVEAEEPGRAPAGDAPKLSNYARLTEVRNGQRVYQWRVFVDEPPQALRSIRRVEYVLDRTYSRPFRMTTDRDKQFELTEFGSRPFTIVATIRYTNGRSVKVSYTLDFTKRWPAGPPREE